MGFILDRNPFAAASEIEHVFPKPFAFGTDETVCLLCLPTICDKGTSRLILVQV